MRERLNGRQTYGRRWLSAGRYRFVSQTVQCHLPNRVTAHVKPYAASSWMLNLAFDLSGVDRLTA